MMTGKTRARLQLALSTLALTGFMSQAGAQAGSEKQEWAAKDKPGDGVAEVVLADGSVPMACRVEVSVKGGPGCTKVMCKGEQPVMTADRPQSMMAAKRIALTKAKAHYTHFLEEELKNKRVTDAIDAAISNEGGPKPGTQESNAYFSAENTIEQASALIKGFAVIEDGFEKMGTGQVAYVIGGVSCITQKGADNLSAGNRRDNSDAAPAKKATGVGADGATVPTRRRAGADQM